MCRRKFRPIKYSRRYSYAKFGTFFSGHPVFQLSVVFLCETLRAHFAVHLRICLVSSGRLVSDETPSGDSEWITASRFWHVCKRLCYAVAEYSKSSPIAFNLSKNHSEDNKLMLISATLWLLLIWLPVLPSCEQMSSRPGYRSLIYPQISAAVSRQTTGSVLSNRHGNKISFLFFVRYDKIIHLFPKPCSRVVYYEHLISKRNLCY